VNRAGASPAPAAERAGPRGAGRVDRTKARASKSPGSGGRIRPEEACESAESKRRPVRDTVSQILARSHSLRTTSRPRPGRDRSPLTSRPVPRFPENDKSPPIAFSRGRPVTVESPCPRIRAQPARNASLPPRGRTVTPARQPPPGRHLRDLRQRGVVADTAAAADAHPLDDPEVYEPDAAKPAASAASGGTRPRMSPDAQPPTVPARTTSGTPGTGAESMTPLPLEHLDCFRPSPKHPGKHPRTHPITSGGSFPASKSGSNPESA
jgi:hypothetical protein